MKQINILMTKKEANNIVGGLSETEKMPCKSYNIPAETCITGSKLRKINNSVCSACYACNGRYKFPDVQNALYRRFEQLNHPKWMEAMVTLVKDMPYFRWHDSGDIQSVAHLKQIVGVCYGTPKTKHWLPTRESKMVHDFWKECYIPLHIRIPNLCIRLSGNMIDGKGPYRLAKEMGCVVSEVSSTSVFTCPASKQDNQCKDCRKCWDNLEGNVVYHKH